MWDNDADEHDNPGFEWVINGSDNEFTTVESVGQSYPRFEADNEDDTNTGRSVKRGCHCPRTYIRLLRRPWQ